MKYIEIGWNDIRKNIRRNRKVMLIIFTVFFFIGVLWGYIEMISYKQEVYMVDDTVLQKVDLKHLEKDETYYYCAFMELKEKNCGLNAYIQYLKQVNLKGENLKKVSQMEELSIDQKQKFNEIQEFFISEKPMICDDLKATEQFIIQKLDAARHRLDKASKILEEKEEKAEKKDRNLKVYAEQEIEILEDYLEKIDMLDQNLLQKANTKMDQLLEEGIDSINMLIEEFNVLIADIEAEEQYEIIYNPYLLGVHMNMAGIVGEFYEEDAVNVKKNEALIYARSIAGVDSREERFYAVLTFSLLLGTALSLLYGSFKFDKGAAGKCR